MIAIHKGLSHDSHHQPLQRPLQDGSLPLGKCDNVDFKQYFLLSFFCKI